MILVAAAILFFVLSPGILITIPPGSFFSGRTSVVAAAVHAAVFFVVGYLFLYGFPGADGFRNLSLEERYSRLYPVGYGSTELGYPRGTLAQIAV